MNKQLHTQSPSKKYHVEYVYLKNDLYNKYNLGNLDELWLGKSRFILVNIINNEDNLLVYSYKQRNEIIKPCNKFVSINNEDWWFGGRDFQYKIIINLNTEELYDESRHINILDNLTNVFIWRDIEASPDGKTIIVSGYNNILINISNISCTFRLFDISRLFIDGLIEISLKHIIGDEKLYEFDKESQWITYSFYDNRSIIKKKWDYINSYFITSDEIIIFN